MAVTTLEERSLDLLKSSIAKSFKEPERFNNRFQAGAIAMREMIAKNYEDNGFVNHAFAIRHTWDRTWGIDPHSPNSKKRKGK
jgi:hypothetical protein